MKGFGPKRWSLLCAAAQCESVPASHFGFGSRNSHLIWFFKSDLVRWDNMSINRVTLTPKGRALMGNPNTFSYVFPINLPLL